MKEGDDIKKIVAGIISSRGTSPEAVIPVLQDIQNRFNYLPSEALSEVCRISSITPSVITGVSSFYSQFRLNPAGKHSVKVCTGTACHVKGAINVYDALRRELDLRDHEDTDRRGIFTIEKVACLGCCTLAPVVKIDGITYGHIQAGKAKDIFKDFLGREKELLVPSSRLKSNFFDGEIRIGLGSCCIASGSEEVKKELENVIAATGIRVNVKQVGCVGICHQVPVLEIVKDGENTAFYARVAPGDVREIILNHFRPRGIFNKIKNAFDGLITNTLEQDIAGGYEIYETEQRDSPVAGFLGPQMTIATEHRGILKPCDFDEYLKTGGFSSLSDITGDEITEIIKKSGLRGRGGAGFPTGTKWEIVRDQPEPEKYIICNGDEGDPGAFMDRMLLESYPFRIIEGMMFAARATGARNAIFYIRAEYPLAVTRIREALEICSERGVTGDVSFSVFEGAGAFVCGEESALIASMEGKRGLPRMRPPYPAVKGFRGKPTLVNNAETYAMIPWIIRNGSEKFAGIGTKASKGTKVFALAGKVKRGGLIEVPMGTTIRQIVEEIGGGIAGGRNFKAVQIGGPSGGCIPSFLADLPVDFEDLKDSGAMMGSGGMVVLDDSDCMVDIARYFLAFTQNQSCGKCTFCRIGTRRMLEILDRIRSGKAVLKDITELENLAESTRKGSLCGLGKSAPNPVISTLRFFRDEYLAHLEGRCPSGKCHDLITYSITDDCIGCTRCAQDCPSGAIEYKPYEVHSIDIEKCIKCDICRQVCTENCVIAG